MPAVKSKTARRRLITMAPNLRHGFLRTPNHTGRLWTKHRENYHFVVKR